MTISTIWEWPGGSNDLRPGRYGGK